MAGARCRSCPHVIAAALWHGPFGAADRLARELERSARQTLVANDAPAGVTARIHHATTDAAADPFGTRRRLPATESARLLSEIPGVSDASWNESRGIPLIVEGIGTARGLPFGAVARLSRRASPPS